MTPVKIFDHARKSASYTPVYMPTDLKSRVHEMAERAGCSVSELMRRFAEIGLQEAERQWADR